MASDSSQYGFSDRYQTSAYTPDSSQAGSSRAPGLVGLGARRRKAPDSVTQNACTNCKKARAKCDGVKPRCKRCTLRNVECHYEMHSKTAKEQMVREIMRLQKENETLEEEKERFGEKNDWIERIIDSIKDDKQGAQIIRKLKQGEDHQAIAEWLGRPLEPTKDLSPTSGREANQAIERYRRDFVDSQDPCYWTSVTNNSALIYHLIRLYFVWIHPVHMLFDERRFVASFKACSDVYCSAALVNAICAMSCHLHHTELEQNPEHTKEEMDLLRSDFLKEVHSHLKGAAYSKLTVIQTYAIIFLVEIGTGNGQLATAHLRLATESWVFKQQAEQNWESEEVTASGVITLHTTWSGFIYQKPSAPMSFTRNLDLKDLPIDQPDDPWSFYRYPGDEPSFTDHPSYALLTVSEQAKLYRILHQTILDYCAHKGKLSAQKLSALYRLYLDWKGNLPAVVRDGETPHAVFLRIQYHTALLNLFQPLLELENMTRDSYEYLRDRIIEHAHQGLDLLKQYRLNFTSHFQSPLQLFCNVHVCDAFVKYGRHDLNSADTIRFCLESLQQAKVGYPIAGPLQKMFCLSMAEYDVPVPDDLVELVGHTSEYDPEDFLDACTRTTYKQPISQIIPNLHYDLGDEFVRDCQEAARKNSMKIDSLLNS